MSNGRWRRCPTCTTYINAISARRAASSRASGSLRFGNGPTEATSTAASRSRSATTAAPSSGTKRRRRSSRRPCGANTKRCRAETHWDRQRPAAEMIGRRARSAPHDTSRHGSAILLSTPLSASPHAVRHRHAESHYGRADAPATAAAPPVAAPPRPARWVAAQPDHGAAPPRARASCRQRSVVPSARVIVRTSRPTC